MKTCTKCKQIKPLTEFHKQKNTKDGLKSHCKECIKEYRQNNKERIAEYRQNNKERLNQISKQYRQNNKEHIAQYNKQYRQKNKEFIFHLMKEYREKNKESLAQYKKEYRQKNKKHMNKHILEYRKNRIQTDDIYKAKEAIRLCIKNSIYRMGYTKQSKTQQILGCSFEEFKTHIEQQFAPGMSWDNRDQWHLDHKDPVSLATTEEEVIRLNHYKNFQPLWAEDNMQKSNKTNWEKDPSKYGL